MQADVLNLEGLVVGQLELNEHVFGLKPNRAVVHQTMVAQLANARVGTASTKTRGQVAGGGRKPYRQKGTGHARQGSIRAPHYRGGGIVFGPHPRSFAQRLPRKMRRLAMRSALSAKAAATELLILESLELESAKTKGMQRLLKALALQGKTLIVTAETNETMKRASANISQVRTSTPESLNLLDVLNCRHLLMTSAAVERVTVQLTAEIRRGKTAGLETSVG